MTDWRQQLQRITAQHSTVRPERSWDALVAEADATNAVAVALAGRQRRSDGVVDTAALAVDAADLYEPDELREEILAAIRHGGSRAYGDLDEDAIIEQVLAMSPERLQGMHNNLQGAAMELKVQELADAGALDLPEGATFRLNEDYTTTGYDGVLEYEDGREVLVQIKASADSSIIEDHLDAHPDVPTVFTNREAAEAAEQAGLGELADVEAVDVELSDLTPGVDGLAEELTDSGGELLGEALDELPVLALGIVAAQAAWAVHRGADVAEEMGRVKRRATSIGLWSALGLGVEAVTGSAGLRALAMVGGKGSVVAVQAVERSAERVSRHGLAQIRTNRRLLAMIADSA